MKIGIVGYQGSGKSTLFHWLTGEAPDPSLSHRTQSAMAEVPEPRVAGLCDVYRPKKVTLASLELVDTPGLSRSHEDNAARLAAIREAGCLVMVIRAYGDSDAAADLGNFRDDLLIADLSIVQNRIERLREALKKPRPNRAEQQAELDVLLPLGEALEQGKALASLEMNPDQRKMIRSFQLFSDKPRFVIMNADEDGDRAALEEIAGELPCAVVSLAMELELQAMEPDDREAFCREMGVTSSDRDGLIRRLMEASGQMLFFTAGDREVRTWMIHRGGTAIEAADGIHTDMARGFIRAEVMNCDDLIRLGSEREMKAQNLMRQEPKDYEIQEGDVLLIRHN